MRITEYYGISSRVPFADVNVLKDSPIFVDPHAIRLASGPVPYAAQAVNCLDTFFHTVSTCVTSRRPAMKSFGHSILCQFREPWETRLGLSAAGFRGHGGASRVGDWIWGALTTDLEVFIRVGLLAQAEDIPMLVRGVGNDITSDLTTRIVYAALADFSEAMLTQFPELTRYSSARSVPRQVWDPSVQEWRDRPVTLPVVKDRPLLLVPRDWARPSLLMGARRYYQRSVMGYVQEQYARYDDRGRRHAPTKDGLMKKEFKFTHDRMLGTTISAYHDGKVNLVKSFKNIVATDLKLVDDETWRRKTA